MIHRWQVNMKNLLVIKEMGIKAIVRYPTYVLVLKILNYVGRDVAEQNSYSTGGKVKWYNCFRTF